MQCFETRSSSRGHRHKPMHTFLSCASYLCPNAFAASGQMNGSRTTKVGGSTFLHEQHCRVATSHLATFERNNRATATRRRQTAVASEGSPSHGLEKAGNSFQALKDIEEIQKILPHRFPFLLVDRVIELELQKYAVGYKNVTANDNFFTGHFPERKIMPGVLQVEALAQLGGIVMMNPERDPSEQQNFFFGGIEACKFRRPVVPGDVLMMRVELTKFNKRFGIAKMSAKAYVGAELCCEADLTLVLAK